MPLTPGTRLGPYEIDAPIGAGGMGEVYRARDPRLGRAVAIKVLSASLSTDADLLRRFEQEARAASALNHSNILTIHDIGRTKAGRISSPSCSKVRRCVADGGVALPAQGARLRGADCTRARCGARQRASSIAT